MSVNLDTKLHLWVKPVGGEWSYLESVEDSTEKRLVLEKHRKALGKGCDFRFLLTKEKWHGRTYRMKGLNRNEQALLKSLIRNKTLDIYTPFEAKQALEAIEIQRREEGKSVYSGLPNKYRMNYIFKKTEIFSSHKASNGSNLWVYNEVDE